MVSCSVLLDWTHDYFVFWHAPHCTDKSRRSKSNSINWEELQWGTVRPQVGRWPVADERNVVELHLDLNSRIVPGPQLQRPLSFFPSSLCFSHSAHDDRATRACFPKLFLSSSSYSVFTHASSPISGRPESKEDAIHWLSLCN